jgi:hypothetical protein
MDSIIKRLLIFTLFVTVSFSIGVPEFRLVNFTGSLSGQYPTATQINQDPFNFTTFPGPAFIEITAVSSVAVCISPYAAITSNLATQCPNLVNFYYTSSAETEFLLFLDDFSMNFMGVDKRTVPANDAQVPPYQPQFKTVSLLQNVPYYVSIGLIDNFPANSTQLEILDFSLSAHFVPCPPNTVANPQAGEKNQQNCIPIQSQLTPAESSSPQLKVDSANPVVFSFQIPSLALEARLDFHVQSLDYNLEIYFGFGYVPNKNRFDSHISNHSVVRLDQYDQMTAEFLGDIVQTFSYILDNPKVGTYYARIYSSLIHETNFNIEFNITECNPAVENQCGDLTFTSTNSGDLFVANITLSDTAELLSIAGTSAIFGLTTNGAGNAYVQLDVDAIPDPTVNNSLINQLGNTISINLNSNTAQNFILSLLSGNGMSQDDSEITALIWTGSVCPNGCSSQGTCDPTTLACSCNDNFSGAYCQIQNSSPPPEKKKKLSTLYIILIIIGSAILLAILIGVPVALFLNNRKKARYERV